MDRLDELEILVAIVTAGSMRQAARRLRKSPASTTRALERLESRLGVRLVERTTRRIAPTATGLKLADGARDVLDSYRMLTMDTGVETIRGMVRIAAPPVFGRLFVAPAVDRFLQEWPDASAEMILADRYMDFIEHRLDVAVRIGMLPDSSLRARKVGSVHWMTVCSPAYIKASGVPARPSDLSDHATILESWSSGGPQWTYKMGAKVETVALNPRLVANDIDIQLDAARSGKGIARVLSYQAASDLAAGKLVRILEAYETAEIPVHVVTAGGSIVENKTRAIADHLSAFLKTSLIQAGTLV
ncbi:MAG: LysR family transcriptional regulator [Alphaproteobacteria bacterium]|nr:LysR family transcriptional regulator [Alphaproteobacteria bacterium]